VCDVTGGGDVSMVPSFTYLINQSRNKCKEFKMSDVFIQLHCTRNGFGRFPSCEVRKIKKKLSGHVL
jgi:hypothetical protein